MRMSDEICQYNINSIMRKFGENLLIISYNSLTKFARYHISSIMRKSGDF